MADPGVVSQRLYVPGGGFSAQRIWIYLAATYAVSWLFWLPVIQWKNNPVFLNLGGGPAIVAILLAARGENNRRDVRRLKVFLLLVPLFWPVVVVAASWSNGVRWPLSWNPWLLLPASIAAWIISGAWSHDGGVRGLMQTLVRPGNWKWPVLSFTFFPALLLGSAALGKLLHLPVAEPANGAAWTALLPLCLVRFVHDLAFTASYEEPGWRGFLLPELQKRFSPLVASLFVWPVWALWHAPLDFSGGLGSNLAVWVQVRVFYFLAITILLTWLYNQPGSLLNVTVFHAAFNVFPFLLPYSPPLLGVIFIWAAWVVVSKRMWRRVIAVS